MNKMKKLLVTFILFMGIFCVNGIQVQAASKVNPSVFAKAPTVTEEKKVDVNKVKPFEVRYYKFVPKKSGRYYVMAQITTISMSMPHVYVYGADGTLLNNGNREWNESISDLAYLQYDYVAGKTYYIGIRDFSTDLTHSNSFKFVVTNTPYLTPCEETIYMKEGTSKTLTANYTHAVGTVTYQWYESLNYGYEKIEGATKRSYTITPTKDSTYRCYITDARGFTFICNYYVSFKDTFTATGPSDVVIPWEDESADIRVEAISVNGKPCTYQWYKHDGNAGGNYEMIEGATSATYNAPRTGNYDLYECVVSCEGEDPITVHIAVMTTGDTMIVSDTDLLPVVKKGESVTFHMDCKYGVCRWDNFYIEDDEPTEGDSFTVSSVTEKYVGKCRVSGAIFYRDIFCKIITEEEKKEALEAYNKAQKEAGVDDEYSDISGKDTPLKKGSSITSKGLKYKVTNAKNKTVTLVSATKKTITKAVIPATVKKNGVTYKVTAVSDNAFKNYKNLKIVTIGSNITKIGKSAFYGCKKLTKITIKSSKLKKSSVGKNALKGTNKKLVIKVPKKQVKSYKAIFKNKGNKSVQVKK